jgi:hypothetical protein
MAEERLEGGYADGAVRVGSTVRRPAGPWTPAVHALLAYSCSGTTAGFLAVVEARMTAHAAGIRDKAAVDQALADLASFPR